MSFDDFTVGEENRFSKYISETELAHHGILGQKWGVRRYQNSDGTLTAEGRARNAKKSSSATEDAKKATKNTVKAAAGTAAAIAISNKAAIAGIRLSNDLVLGKVGYYTAIKPLEALTGAAQAARVANNVSHVASMLAGKSIVGEMAASAVASSKAAIFGAKTVSSVLGSYGNAAVLSNALLTTSNIAAGAAIAGLAITGVAAGVTAYKTGKAIKQTIDNKRAAKADN